MSEAYSRGLPAGAAEADDGKGLLTMMTFVLMVARQQLSEGATDQQEEQLQEMGGTLRAGVKRLFRSLFRQKGRGGQGEGQRKVESEVLEWVASRLGPEQLGRLMFRQQCRAYSRAAGFRAICELLQAAEGWESDRLVFWPADALGRGCDLPLTPVTRAAIECFVKLKL